MTTWSLWLLPALALPPADASWEEIQDAPVHIRCTTVAGAPWCQASAQLDQPLATVKQALEARDRHADWFDNVSRMEELEPGLLWVRLDYPSPLQDRDYVARYEHHTEGEVEIYTWSPVSGDPRAPAGSTHVRLEDFAGEWRLSPSGSGTQVRYTWHASLGGAVPGWIERRARKVAGTSVLSELAAATGASLDPP